MRPSGITFRRHKRRHLMAHTPEQEKGFFQQLEQLQQLTQHIDSQLNLGDLLTPAFLQAHTRFASLEELLGGQQADSIDAFAALPDTSFLEKTDYDSVEALLNAAMDTYVGNIFA